MKKVENLKDKTEKICILSSKAPKPVIRKLESLGYLVKLLPVLPGLNCKEGHHADMQLCRVSEKEIVYAPGVAEDILNAIKKRGVTLIKGATTLKPKYPYNIAYNVLALDTIFFHNTKFTDSVLMKKFLQWGQTPECVKQGYGACSSFVVYTKNGTPLVLTGDKGIYAACGKNKTEVILCQGVENIRLRGYDHGFVGGSMGRDGKILYTCGSIEKTFDNGKEIMKRLKEEGITVVNLWGGRLRDIGGILIV